MPRLDGESQASEVSTVAERLWALGVGQGKPIRTAPESERPGLLLVVDGRTIGGEGAAEADAVIARARQGEREGAERLQGEGLRELRAAEEVLEKLNFRKHKSSGHQARRVLRRLRRAGFEVVQNARPRTLGKGGGGSSGGAGGGGDSVHYVRLRLSERMLMLAAHEMGSFWKKLKPALVPEDSGAEVGELPTAPTRGGYLPYTLSRADAYRLPELNVGGECLEAAAALGKGGLCSGLGWDLRPAQRLGGIFELPHWPRATAATGRGRIASNPASLELKAAGGGGGGGGGGDAPPPSSFTQAETLAILWWWLEHRTGLDVIQPKLPATGGRLELWERRSEEEREQALADKGGQKPSWGLDLGSWLADSEWGGAALGMLHFTDLMPYHTPAQQTWLEEHWAFAVGRAFRRHGVLRFWRVWRVMASQPLEQIRNYFGSKVALYFAFVEYMWQSLLVPAFFSVVIYGYALYRTLTDGGSLTLLEALRKVHESWATPLFAICICLWSTLFVVRWRARDHTLSLRWGTVGLKRVPRYRAEWLEKYETVFGTDDPNEVDPFKAAELDSRWGLSCGRRAGHCLPSLSLGMRGRLAASMATMTTFGAVSLAIVFANMLFQLVESAQSDTLGIYMASAANGVSVVIISFVYQKVALKLTKWEMHRTDQAYEDSYAAKLFALEFVNHFFGLLWIAFAKPFVGPSVLVALVPGLVVVDPPTCMFDNCMWELMVQLSIQMFVKAIFQKVASVVQLRAVSAWRHKRLSGTITAEDVVWFEQERSRLGMITVIDEYKELVLYYGYIVMFAAAFPFAPILALIVVQLEWRTDAYRKLSAKRPQPETVDTIGIWAEILSALSRVGIITNIALVTITMNADGRRSLFGDGSEALGTWGTPLIAFLVSENLLLGLQWIIRQAVKQHSTKDLAQLYRQKEKLTWLHRAIKYEGYAGRRGRAGKWVFTGIYDGNKLRAVSRSDSAATSHLSFPEMRALGLNQLLAADAAGAADKDDDDDEEEGGQGHGAMERQASVSKLKATSAKRGISTADDVFSIIEQGTVSTHAGQRSKGKVVL